MPPEPRLDLLFHLSAPGHHPDCDRVLHHVITAVQRPDGTWNPSCSRCGPVRMVHMGQPYAGLSAGSPAAALACREPHINSEPCRGECLAWEERAA